MPHHNQHLQAARLEPLPTELLHNIIEQLQDEPRAIAQLAKTCRRLRHVILSDGMKPVLYAAITRHRQTLIEQHIDLPQFESALLKVVPELSHHHIIEIGSRLNPQQLRLFDRRKSEGHWQLTNRILGPTDELRSKRALFSAVICAQLLGCFFAEDKQLCFFAILSSLILLAIAFSIVSHQLYQGAKRDILNHHENTYAQQVLKISNQALSSVP